MMLSSVAAAAASLVIGGSRFPFLLLSLTLIGPVARVAAVEIRRISDRVPDDTFARRVKVDAAGDCFVYESDAQYQYNGMDNQTFGKGFKHIWKTCGVFDGGKVHTLLSTQRTANGEDDDFPTISGDGTRVCYHTKDNGPASTIAKVNTETKAMSYCGIVATDDYDSRKSTYCHISPDNKGSVIAFQSSAQLVGGISNPSNKYQLYVTYNNGETFELLAGKDIANDQTTTLLSGYPQVSAHGRRITFQAKLPYENPGDAPFGIKTNELYLYRKGNEKKGRSGMVERLTSFNENYCDLDLVFEEMKAYWGEANLTAEGITKATSSQCNFAATKGWGGRTSGNLLGAGHGPASISNDGRFIAYTAGFSHATVRGTHEKVQIITADNLFLHDTVLGLIWQLTGEGDADGDPLEFESRVENFCCPSASSSYQRGTCSTKREYTGICCWQRTCWFPAQWPSISGDGTTVAYFASDESTGLTGDYEVVHYHVPTSTKTIVTDTNDKNLDDTYPDVSYTGRVVAFESDYDHTTGESIVSNNQVFVAKLEYGCPHYPSASNYVADPDVAVNCEFPEPTSTVASRHGIRIKLAMDIGSMLSNIPFGKNRDLCEVYCNDLRRDLAYALMVPEALLRVGNTSLKGCKNMESGDTIFWAKINFLGTDDVAFDDVFAKVGEPSDWYDLVETMYDDPSSNFWKTYLLKTAVEIKKKRES